MRTLHEIRLDLYLPHLCVCVCVCVCLSVCVCGGGGGGGVLAVCETRLYIGVYKGKGSNGKTRLHCLWKSHKQCKHVSTSCIPEYKVNCHNQLPAVSNFPE